LHHVIHATTGAIDQTLRNAFRIEPVAASSACRMKSCASAFFAAAISASCCLDACAWAKTFPFTCT
jgi:hypothetical protein